MISNAYAQLGITVKLTFIVAPIMATAIIVIQLGQLLLFFVYFDLVNILHNFCWKFIWLLQDIYSYILLLSTGNKIDNNWDSGVVWSRTQRGVVSNILRSITVNIALVSALSHLTTKLFELKLNFQLDFLCWLNDRVCWYRFNISFISISGNYLLVNQFISKL